MTQAGQTPEAGRAQQTLRMLLLGVLGQVGCLTLLIILVALVAGLWLDNQLHTRPLFVVSLVLVSVPLTLIVMFRLVLALAPKIRTMGRPPVQPTPEEEQRGGQT